jgi:aromatic ring-opening dioxygenase catalytic subunit (LigB family)
VPARLPVLFVSHGSPMVALGVDSYTQALRRWSTSIPRPAAIVVVGALAGDVEALVAYERSAPHASLAVPTSEHFDPLLVVLGAAVGDRRVTDVYAGFRYGSLSMRSFTLSS